MVYGGRRPEAVDCNRESLNTSVFSKAVMDLNANTDWKKPHLPMDIAVSNRVGPARVLPHTPHHHVFTLLMCVTSASDGNVLPY